MMLNATFSNISVISWRPVLLVEVTGENQRPVASQWQTLSHNVMSSTAMNRARTHNVSGDEHCKSNYHTTMTTTAPWSHVIQIDNQDVGKAVLSKSFGKHFTLNDTRIQRHVYNYFFYNIFFMWNRKYKFWAIFRYCVILLICEIMTYIRPSG